MIIQDLKARALEMRKAKDPLGAVMQFHVSEITNIGKNKNRETTEEEAVQYIKKTVQKLKEDTYSDYGEIVELECFLPKMASEEEVRAFLDTIDTSNKGMVMKAVKEHFGVLVDTKMVNGML